MHTVKYMHVWYIIYEHLYVYTYVNQVSKHKLHSFLLHVLFLHIHPWVCMFFINCLQCSGHSLSGNWGCEALANSVMMKPPVRKPRGQSSLGALPPRPPASALSGNCLLQIPQEWVKPLVGSMGSRTFPGGSQGNCPRPPSSETLLSPRAQGVLLSAPPRELPADGETLSPSGSDFIAGFLLGDFYLLNAKVKNDCVLCLTGLNFKELNPEWPILSDLLWVSGGNIHSYPFACKLRAKFPLEVFVLVFFLRPALYHLFPIPCANQHTFSNFTEQNRIYKIM